MNEQPAFGEADLSNCERELIHLAGSVQPHGALLVLRAAASESGVLDHDLFSIDGESDPLTGSELAGFRAGARLALQLLGESIA